MNPFLVELRHSTFRFAAPAVFALTSLVSLTAAFPSVASWSNLLSTSIASTQLAGPLLAGFAAWEGLRPYRRQLDDLEETSARTPIQVRWYQFAAALAWVAMCSLVVALAMWIRAVTIGLSGQPTIPGLLTPLAASLIAVTVGFVCAELARKWFAVIIASGALIALVALDSAPAPLWAQALSPIHHLAVLDHEQPNQALLWGQIVVALGTSVALISLTSLVRRARVRTPMVAMAALGVAAMCLGGTVVFAQHGQNAVTLQADRLKWIQVSDPDSGIRLQVLDLYGPVASNLQATWSRVAALTAESDLSFNELTQDPEPDYANAPYETFHRLDLNPHARDIAASSVEMAFYDLETCATQPTPDSSDWAMEGSIIVRTWFQGAHDFPSTVSFVESEPLEALHALHQLTPAEARQWVHDHAVNIRSCNWDRRDFPTL